MVSWTRYEEVTADVVDPRGTTVTVEAQRSGSVHWQYEAATMDYGLVIAPFAAFLNVFAHYVLWRRGWSLAASIDDKRVWRKRYKDHATALSSLPEVTALIAAGGISSLG